MLQSLLFGILFMTVTFLSKEFARVFTNSEEMIRAAADLAYVLGVSVVLNSASHVMLGECFKSSVTFCSYLMIVLLLVQLINAFVTCPLRCGHWEWMASYGCLHKPGMLLYCRTPYWIFPRFKSTFRGQGKIVLVMVNVSLLQ